jgi:hypothetical protein
MAEQTELTLEEALQYISDSESSNNNDEEMCIEKSYEKQKSDDVSMEK